MRKQIRRGLTRFAIVASLVGTAADARPLAQRHTVPGSAELRGAAAELQTAAAAVAQVTTASDGFALDAAPGAPAKLEVQWRALRQWTALWLAAHPGTGAAQIATAAKREVDAEMEVHPLGGGAVLVGATIEALGTAFILRPAASGRFVTALALDEPGTWAGGSQGGGPPELAAWRSDRASFACRDKLSDAQWAQCGPMAPSAQLLPAEGNGAKRFALLGRYVKQMGATDGFQLSIWRWTGTRAEPVLARTFAQMVEQPIFAGVRHGTLKLHAKDQWKRLSACGSCSGRQVELSFALPATGARFAGMRSLTPDLDLIDTVLDRAFRGEPTDDVAAPAVVTALAPKLQAIIADARAYKIDAYAGMVMGWKPLASRRGSRVVCLDADSLDGALLFTIDARRARPRVSAVAPAPAKACTGRDARV